MGKLIKIDFRRGRVLEDHEVHLPPSPSSVIDESQILEWDYPYESTQGMDMSMYYPSDILLSGFTLVPEDEVDRDR